MRNWSMFPKASTKKALSLLTRIGAFYVGKRVEQQRIAELNAENAALRAELRHWLEEIAGTPPEALWQMQDDRLRYVEIQIAKKDYEAARKRLEEL